MGDDGLTRKTETAARFNKMATDFDSLGAFAHFGQRLVEVVGIEPGQHVLDVATGRGAVLFPAIERVGTTGEAVGVDLADGMVKAANEEAERRGWGSRVRAMDAEQLNFPDAAFDRILCGFGIMFFPHLDQALGEFHRVLKPGGRLGVSTWRVSQAEDLRAVLDELSLVGSDERPPGWITEPDDLTRVLMNAGFIDVQVVTDSMTYVYADVEEYWNSVRGTGPRRIVDALDTAQVEGVRVALAERFLAYARPDGVHIVATALLGTGSR